jgi:co-chaperonin GroES (HSP10)
MNIRPLYDRVVVKRIEEQEARAFARSLTKME